MEGFEYIDRGKKDTLVLIPGWALDYRVFGNLDLNFNYILSKNFSFFNFKKELFDFLEYKKIKKVSLFGFSLGGFLSVDFALSYPERIKKLILVSIRKKYNKDDLEEIEAALGKNKRAFLYKFYRNLFYYNLNFLRYRELFRYYIDNLSLESLMDGLSYLKIAEFSIEPLRKLNNIKFIHGKNDKIAPILEVISIKESLRNAELIVFENTGHLVFLEKNIDNTL